MCTLDAGGGGGLLITRELDYALRILRALSLDGGTLSAASIAQMEHMPKAVTLKILRRLHAAGFVSSSRGSGGGYALRQASADITLYDLFSALGEPLRVNRCQEPGYLCENRLPETCGICREFSRLQDVLDAELRRTPLRDLFARSRPNPTA